MQHGEARLTESQVDVEHQEKITKIQRNSSYQQFEERKNEFLECSEERREYVKFLVKDMKHSKDNPVRYLNCLECLLFGSRRKVGKGKMHNTDKFRTVSQIVGPCKRNIGDHYEYFNKHFLEPNLQKLIGLGLAKEQKIGLDCSKIIHKPLLVSESCQCSQQGDKSSLDLDSTLMSLEEASWRLATKKSRLI